MPLVWFDICRSAKIASQRPPVDPGWTTVDTGWTTVDTGWTTVDADWATFGAPLGGAWREKFCWICGTSLNLWSLFWILWN